MITLSQMKGKKGKCRAHDPSKCRFHAGCHKENGGESEFEFPSWIDEDVFPMENWKRYFDLALPHFNALQMLTETDKRDESKFRNQENELSKCIGVLFGLGEKQSHIEIGKCNFGGSKEAEESFLRAIDFYERLCPQKIMPKEKLNCVFSYGAKDSQFDPLKQTCFMGDSSFFDMVHEIAHFVEFNNNVLRHLCEEYLDLRCGDEVSHVIEVGENGEKIYGREDKFFDAYTGRDYIVKFGNGKNAPTLRIMTEILSTGMQFATHEPFTLYKNDKDLFAFSVKALKGEM